MSSIYTRRNLQLTNGRLIYKEKSFTIKRQNESVAEQPRIPFLVAQP